MADRNFLSSEKTLGFCAGSLFSGKNKTGRNAAELKIPIIVNTSLGFKYINSKPADNGPITYPDVLAIPNHPSSSPFLSAARSATYARETGPYTAVAKP